MRAMTMGQGRPAWSRIAATAFTSASTEPTERSMPPVVMTKVIAMAVISSGALCRRRFRMFVSERKASVPSPKPTVIRTKKPAMLRTGACAASMSAALRRASVGRLARLLMTRPARARASRSPTMRPTRSSRLVSPIRRSATLRPS